MPKKKPNKHLSLSVKRKSVRKKMVRVRAAKRLKSSDFEEIAKTNDQCVSHSDWGPEPEHFPELVIEPDHVKMNHFEPQGRRIVNIAHVMKQKEVVGRHSLYCTAGQYKLKSENMNGVACSWNYFCDNCERHFVITSEPSDAINDVNQAVVWGSIAIGNGYYQTEEFFSVLDLPMMSAKKFATEEVKIEEVWEKQIDAQMEAAAKEEKEIALRKGHLIDGIPYITVVGDGGWSKRSYGHSYSGSSGVAVIIGEQTKKILHLEVKNKFCSVCASAKSRKKSVSEHKCYRNYKGPSTGMESEAIVEGFSLSKEKYGIVYRYYIGDGDSSVYRKLLEGGHRYVVKMECANHMVRCLSNKLHKLAKDTKLSTSSRRLLTEQQVTNIEGVRVGCFTRIERLVKGVRVAIKEAGKSGNIEQLRSDVKNAPYHVLGRHDNCRKSFCSREGEIDHTNDAEISGLLGELLKAVDPIVCKADRLKYNQTTNQAERYMGLVSKFSGAKRVNYSNRGSYRRRCLGAAQSHTKGPSWHISPWKKLTGRSPGKLFKKKFTRREEVRARKSLKDVYGRSSKKRKRPDTSQPDEDYGVQSIALDIDEDEMRTRCEEVVSKLKAEVDTTEKRDILERQTRGQHENAFWRSSRIHRLTASNFGKICKRKDTTLCHNILKTLLYSQELHSKAILYGRVNEVTALKKYEQQQSVKVDRCGLFVSESEPYLGASPDGLVGSDGLIEIKCISKIGEKSFLEAATDRKGAICLEVRNDGSLQLNRNHDYYFQIQGQMNIANKLFCDFIVYSACDFFVERIEKDEKFWKDIMLPQLRRFYFNCMLPEIVDGRIPRKLPAREPDFVLEATQKMKANKKQKCRP